MNRGATHPHTNTRRHTQAPSTTHLTNKGAGPGVEITITRPICHLLRIKRPKKSVLLHTRFLLHLLFLFLPCPPLLPPLSSPLLTNLLPCRLLCDILSFLFVLDGCLVESLLLHFCPLPPFFWFLLDCHHVFYLRRRRRRRVGIRGRRGGRVSRGGRGVIRRRGRKRCGAATALSTIPLSNCNLLLFLHLYLPQVLILLALGAALDCCYWFVLRARGVGWVVGKCRVRVCVFGGGGRGGMLNELRPTNSRQIRIAFERWMS